ncbi:MAG: hypothetical protein K6U87_06345, partial [Firmicutes bacterium]|nr:hypothetical protein [Bacillota bacterium]
RPEAVGAGRGLGLHVLWIGGETLPVEAIMAAVQGPLTWERVPADEAMVRERIGQADVVVTKVFTPAMGERASRLRFLQCYTNGVDDLDWSAIGPEVVVARVFGHEVAVAEHALALWLAVAKRVVSNHRKLVAHDWSGGFVAGGPFTSEVSGSTALAIGMGAIAEAFVGLTQGFGLRWLAVRQHPERGAPPGVEVAGVEALPRMWPQADVILVAAPLTPSTRHLIGRELLERSKSGAILVNVARAGLIDHQALYEALRSGKLAGAGLDVFPHAPRRAGEHPAPFGALPLEQLENVVVTPHVAAWTARTRERRMQQLVANLSAYACGGTIRYRVARPSSEGQTRSRDHA